MAFRFDFSAEELDDDFSVVDDAGDGFEGTSALDHTLPSGHAEPEEQKPTVELDECVEISLDELISALPPMISYTPLALPAHVLDANESSNANPRIIIPRRDLFDVRFQLLNESSEDEEETADQKKQLDFVDAPSDLLPGVYEGGLKTWECSIDLAGYLAHSAKLQIRGRRVLELGCGTAIPSLYLLSEAFKLSPPAEGTSAEDETLFCLQDYNRSALEWMALPNIILTWYLSPASSTFRASVSHGTQSEAHPPTSDSQLPSSPTAEPSAHARLDELEIELTPALLDAFRASLASLRMALRFFTGSWGSFVTSVSSPLSTGLGQGQRQAAPFDVVLSSETIYRTSSLPDLIRALYAASASPSSSSSPADDDHGSESTPASNQSLVLVAAKNVYFGVGGGMREFRSALDDGVPAGAVEAGVGDAFGAGGKSEVVWEEKRGVARSILRVWWDDSRTSRSL